MLVAEWFGARPHKHFHAIEVTDTETNETVRVFIEIDPDALIDLAKSAVGNKMRRAKSGPVTAKVRQ